MVVSDWFYSLAQILFPVLLLVPPIITGFRRAMRFEELEIVILITWIYLVLILGSTYHYVDFAGDEDSIAYWVGVCFMMILAMFFISRWTFRRMAENIATSDSATLDLD